MAFELTAVFLSGFDDLFELGVIGIKRHLLSHKRNGAGIDTRQLGDTLFHLSGAVGTFETFELKNLFHDKTLSEIIRLYVQYPDR